MENSDLITCSSCNEEITSDSDFCPHCGVLFQEAENVFCDEHQKNPAQGVCIICQRLICQECGVLVAARTFCQVHRKVKVQEDWAEVFRSTEVADAELIKSLLESTGIEVLEQNFSPKGSIWEGDSSIWRSNINKPAKVLVPIPEYLKAMEVIYDWRSSQAVIQFDETGM
jgi:RNA polymerase subunit RPABC4/transcription elongation factor Spt4